MPGPAHRIALAAAALIALAAVWGVGAWIAAVGGDPRIGPDLAWLDWMSAIRNPVLTAVAVALNAIGGGRVAALIVAAVVLALLITRGWRAALFLALTAAVSSVDVQLLKMFAGRLRPPHDLVAATGGSFPSGHTAAAAVLAVTLGLLLGRRWVWAVGAGWAALMAFSRTYLEVHYLTDVTASVVVATAVAAVLWAALPRALHPARREQEAIDATRVPYPHRPPPVRLELQRTVPHLAHRSARRDPAPTTRPQQEGSRPRA